LSDACSSLAAARSFSRRTPGVHTNVTTAPDPDARRRCGQASTEIGKRYGNANLPKGAEVGVLEATEIDGRRSLIVDVDSLLKGPVVGILGARGRWQEREDEGEKDFLHH